MKKIFVRVLAMTFAFMFLMTLPALVAFGESSDSDGKTWIHGFGAEESDSDGGTWLNGIPLWADLSRINWEKTTFDHWEYLTPELGDSSIPDALLYGLAVAAFASIVLIHVRRKAVA